MSNTEFKEKAREKRKAMVNCSMAMRETILSYGFAATLDFVVRISNYDAIVSELLPYFPSIASAAMLEASNTRTRSKKGEEDPGGPAPQSELPETLAG